MGTKKAIAICTTLGVILGVTAYWLTRLGEGKRRQKPVAVLSPVAVAPPATTRSSPSERFDRPQREHARVGGKTREGKIKPEKLARRGPRLRGTLSVNVSSRYANVYVDGKLRGQTPLEISLPVGSHKVVIEDPDAPAERFSSIVEIKANETMMLKR